MWHNFLYLTSIFSIVWNTSGRYFIQSDRLLCSSQQHLKIVQQPLAIFSLPFQAKNLLIKNIILTIFESVNLMGRSKCDILKFTNLLKFVVSYLLFFEVWDVKTFCGK